jgi:hypothetical protein
MPSGPNETPLRNPRSVAWRGLSRVRGRRERPALPRRLTASRLQPLEDRLSEIGHDLELRQFAADEHRQHHGDPLVPSDYSSSPGPTLA